MKIAALSFSGGFNDDTGLTDFKVVCRDCGMVLNSADRYCPNCGRELERLRSSTKTRYVLRCLNRHLDELMILEDLKKAEDC